MLARSAKTDNENPGPKPPTLKQLLLEDPTRPTVQGLAFRVSGLGFSLASKAKCRGNIWGDVGAQVPVGLAVHP